jgi:hypothetical protein
VIPGMSSIPSITGGAGGSAESSAKLYGGDSAFTTGDWTVSTGRSTATAGLDSKTLLIVGAIGAGLVVLWMLKKKS